MTEFKSWRDIKDWASENGFAKIAKRMQINNDYWMSSGEFGRSQVQIAMHLDGQTQRTSDLLLQGKSKKNLQATRY